MEQFSIYYVVGTCLCVYVEVDHTCVLLCLLLMLMMMMMMMIMIIIIMGLVVVVVDDSDDNVACLVFSTMRGIN